MRVKFDVSDLGLTTWPDHATRFLFGGCITVVAGLVASQFGPVMGGLLLAFPAIFPASATLIEKDEIEKKEKQGLNGTVRGRQAAALDAAGSAMGSVGLFVFALLVWKFATQTHTWIVLPGAMIAWLVVAVLTWEIRQLPRALMRKSHRPEIDPGSI